MAGSTLSNDEDDNKICTSMMYPTPSMVEIVNLVTPGDVALYLAEKFRFLCGPDQMHASGPYAPCSSYQYDLYIDVSP